jgi:VanZ family protein
MLNVPNRSTVATLSKFALGLFWLALFIGTHVPPSTDLLPMPTNDKLAHLAAYLLLALLLATVWQLAGGILNGRHLVFAWLAILAYGAFDEVTQIPIGRDCNLGDWTADACGAAVGLLLFVGLRGIVEKRLRANRNQ